MLVVPDIHERLDQLRKIDSKFGVDEPRIYLGDWFDSFTTSPESRQGTVDYLVVELGRDDRTFLWGNHDYHYVDRRGLASGYSDDMASRIQHTLPIGWDAKFKIFTHHEEWLISHAGFNRPPEEWESKERMLLDVGLCRGGRARVGGPLWLDWNHEFEGIEGVKQIVGHTSGKHPRVNERGINLDCSLTCVARIKFNEVEIISI